MAISSQVAEPGSRSLLGRKAVRHVIVGVLAGLGLIAVVAVGWRALSSPALTEREPGPAAHRPITPVSDRHDEARPLPPGTVVRLEVEQQQAIGLKTEVVRNGSIRQVAAA